MKTKECTICKKTKILDEFHRNKTKSDGRQNICKVCRSKHHKNYYKKNKQRIRRQIAKNKKRHREENKRFLQDYLSTHPCVDCGYDENIAALDFDHVRGKKSRNVSEMINSTLTALKSEISKCEVRCANCHRVKTARDYGWYGQ